MSGTAALSTVDRVGSGESSDFDDFSDAYPSSDGADKDSDSLTLRVEGNGFEIPLQRSLGKLRPDQPRKHRIATQPPPPRQRAKVNSLAELPTEAAANTCVDAHILERIRKCLDRANHPNTPEMEATAALRMSSRLMTQYNISQADVLAQATTSEEQVRLGGESTVVITNTKSQLAKAVSQTWVLDVAIAMGSFFDCKCYSTAWTHKIVWTFYGILQNTVAAATSFEMAHNLILEWARVKKGALNSYCLGVGAGLKDIAREEKRTEERLARKRERDAMNAKIELERIHRQKELDRLHRCDESVGPGPVLLAARVEDEIATSAKLDSFRPLCEEDSSDESAFSPVALPFDDFSTDESDKTETKPTFNWEDELPLNPAADFEEELQKVIKQERSPTPPLAHVQEDSDRIHDGSAGELNSKMKNEDMEGTGLDLKNEPVDDQQIDGFRIWKSSQQVILFRTSAMNIAEEYLKARATKLKTGRKRTHSVRDRGAYEAGKIDSKKIDVRRRRIE